MYDSYGGIVLLGVAATVTFVLAWTRSEETLLYVGHAFTAFAAVFAFLAGPTAVSVAAAAVFVVNAGILVVRVTGRDRRAQRDGG